AEEAIDTVTSTARDTATGCGSLTTSTTGAGAGAGSASALEMGAASSSTGVSTRLISVSLMVGRTSGRGSSTCGWWAMGWGWAGAASAWGAVTGVLAGSGRETGADATAGSGRARSAASS